MPTSVSLAQATSHLNELNAYMYRLHEYRGSVLHVLVFSPQKNRRRSFSFSITIFGSYERDAAMNIVMHKPIPTPHTIVRKGVIFLFSWPQMYTHV